MSKIEQIPALGFRRLLPQKIGSAMTDTRHAIYPHRRNHDGSFDSICRTCFATIAQTRDEASLAQYEKKHHCEHRVLLGPGVPMPETSGVGLYLLPRAVPTDAVHLEPIASLAVR